MRPPFGLIATTDHRRSGAPVKQEARSKRAEARSNAERGMMRKSTTDSKALHCLTPIPVIDIDRESNNRGIQ
jgi:hypothetical protein